MIPPPAEKELMRLRQIKALESAGSSWMDKDHPELKEGAARYVEELRREDEKRFRKVTARRDRLKELLQLGAC